MVSKRSCCLLTTVQWSVQLSVKQLTRSIWDAVQGREKTKRERQERDGN